MNQQSVAVRDDDLMSGAVTAARVKARVQLIQEVMRDVMKKDVHYGIVPGAKKPSLWKAGSETLLATFQLASSPRVEDLSTPDAVRYRVFCDIVSASGVVVGTGVGECSSDEEKYAWREGIGKEWDLTPEDRRREKWKKGNGGAYSVKQVRSNPADQANTVLKMAKKRAQIDGTLTATGASDIFEQDLEDLPEETLAEREAKAPPRQPQPKGPASTAAPAAGDKVTPGMLATLRRELERAAGDDDDLLNALKAGVCKELSVEQLEDLPAARINDAINWAKAKVADAQK